MLLFNWYGYQLLHNCLETRGNQQLVASLDNQHYDESALVSMKVPATHISSYSSASAEFKRIDGQIEVNGVQYNFVKRRFFNDSIEMLCIPNRSSIELNKVKNDYFALVNDLKHPGQEKKSDTHTFKGFSDEYCDFSNSLHIEFPFSGAQHNRCSYTDRLQSGIPSPSERPPQEIA